MQSAREATENLFLMMNICKKQMSKYQKAEKKKQLQVRKKHNLYLMPETGMTRLEI